MSGAMSGSPVELAPPHARENFVIFEKFIRAIKSHQMLERGDRVIVAVSGGADSMALLYLLLRIRKRFDLDLIVAHLNHKLRDVESDSDEQFVREVAHREQLPCVAECIPTEEAYDSSAGNLESWARQKRYDFLDRLVASFVAQKVALGHTMNDQAETLLMRLMKGSGTMGLGAIPPKRQDLFIRPLLYVEREEIMQFLLNKGLGWRNDSSNQDLRFLRNRIRGELIPLLRSGYNPNILRQLSNTSEVLREEAQAMKVWVNETFAQEAIVEEGKVVWSVGKLLNHPPGLQKGLVMKSLKELEKGFISYLDVDSVMGLLKQGKSGRSLKMNGRRVFRDFENLVFSSSRSIPCPAKYKYHLMIPGQIELPQTGTLFQATVDAIPCASGLHNRWEFLLSPEEIRAGVWVRNWQPGDAYCPSGARSPRKLKDLFARRKIPRRLRVSWPVIVTDDKIICVRGFPVAADRTSHAISNEIMKRIIIVERNIEDEAG